MLSQVFDDRLRHLRPTVAIAVDSSSAVGQTSAENLFERILLFIVVLQVIQTIYKRLLGTRGRQTAEPSVQDDTNFVQSLSTRKLPTVRNVANGPARGPTRDNDTRRNSLRSITRDC